MMGPPAWSSGSDQAGVRTAMITPRAVPALLHHPHRRVAILPVTRQKLLCRPPARATQITRSSAPPEDRANDLTATQNGGYLRAGLRPPPVTEGDPISGP